LFFFIKDIYSIFMIIGSFLQKEFNLILQSEMRLNDG
jgi:hypothetical protein